MKLFQQKNLTTILVSSLILTLIWMGLSVYRASKADTISERFNQQITPITPAFDQNAVDAVQKRQNIDPVYTFSGASGSAETTTPSPQVTPQATPSISEASPSAAVAPESSP